MLDRDKIEARERRLLKREKSYRRARIGAWFLAGVSVLGAVAVIVDAFAFQRHPPRPEDLLPQEASFFFWLAIAYAMHARIQHVESLRLREMQPGE